jgi:hypothetical protein
MPQPEVFAGPRLSPAAKAVSLLGRREARLRPEHATRYPGVQAGMWESAAILCDRVLAGRLLRGSPGWRERVLPSEHYDFRGEGVTEERPRREDR